MTRNKTFWLLSVMELVQSLIGKQKFQRGSDRKRRREWFKLNFGGETHFLGGHLFTLEGQRFSGVVTGGC